MEVEVPQLQEIEDKQETIEISEEVISKDIRLENSDQERKTEEQKENKEEEAMIVFLKKRYRCRLALEKMPGDSTEEKLESAVFSFSDYPNFLGAKIVTSKKGHFVLAEFGDYNDMQDACGMSFVDNEQICFEEFAYSPIPDKANRMVRIRNISLNTNEGAIKAILRKFGEIEELSIKKVKMWQTATVTYGMEEQAIELIHRRAIPFAKNQVRILPVRNREK